MHTLFTPLADNLIKAACWTLLHSLWQGLLLAAIAGAIVMSTRKTAAAYRYNLLVALFGTFILVSIGTFIYQLQAGTFIIIEDNIKSGVTATIQNIQSHSTGSTLIERFVQYFNTHAYLIVTIWFICFLANVVKMLAGLIYIQRIRYTGIQQPPIYWTERLQELLQRLRISKPVLLLESELVKVPAALGAFKPVILIPAGLCMQLPPEQVEAILLHELSHIKRRDYFVNLLQTFAGSIFFFNPAVLWVSSLIKTEREHCCDDMVISETGNKRNYIDALVSFQEYAATSNTYAMAFPGEKNHLLHRVKRIIEHHNKSLNNAEKLLLTACLFIVITGATLVTKQKVSKPEPTIKKYVTAFLVGKDTIITAEHTATMPDKDAVLEEPVCIKPPAPPSPLAPYATQAAPVEASSMTDTIVNHQYGAVKPVDYHTQNRIYTRTVTNYKTTTTYYHSDSLEQPTQVTVSPRIVLSGNLTKGDDAPIKVSPKCDVGPKPAESAVIIQDMLNEHVIVNTKELSYKLSRHEFIVNGKIQPESIHKKFSDKYVINKGWAYLYNWSL